MPRRSPWRYHGQPLVAEGMEFWFWGLKVFTVRFLLGGSIPGVSQIVHFLFCLNLHQSAWCTSAETCSKLISLAGQLLDASGRIVSVLLGPSNATQRNV
ncbi:unnamed protein product [Fusarium venenatum]|uniref:Uncharacterized protein n=1 Tax=Fusarium venenatum TaxID=56646 RepID=A0A2L2TNW6_9HYPO|nr:uncharacterized protein FVRRES_01568 [Fusarium venenatum]CEI65056.1 unnamed protein product [Fusarium venenatum]